MNFSKFFYSKVFILVLAFFIFYIVLTKDFLNIVTINRNVSFLKVNSNNSLPTFLTNSSINKIDEGNSSELEINSTNLETDATIIDPIQANKYCYEPHYINENIDYFEDVLQSSKTPSIDKSIFFHETSCSENGQMHLNPRQACAIESAALMNPGLDVFLLVLSPSGLTKNPPEYIKALERYPNIYFRNINFWKYVEGTISEEFIKSDKIFDSDYLINHLADFLRYLTLWKYGGTYLDMDIILKKTLEDIPPNYTGAESHDYLAIGAMNFQHDGIGHLVVDRCLRNLQENFNGHQWAYNGNGVLTRVLDYICKTILTKDMTAENCSGFRVYSKETFYAIEWPSWKLFFEEDQLNNVLEKTRDSILVHVWNKLSKNEKFRVGSKVAYGIYAEKYCPKVYASCGEFF